jgi:hypothetical protein
MDVSPSRQMFRTAFSAGAQARVYPAEEKEGVFLVDAAEFWGIGGGGAVGSGGEVTTSRSNWAGVGTVGDDTKASTETPSTPPKVQISDGKDSLMPLNRRGGEGIAMPFDMDVPVACKSHVCFLFPSLPCFNMDIMGSRYDALYSKL